jgi:capsular exopolysaccharide synthesis family protein
MKDDFQNIERASSGFNIDIKRIGYRAIQYWYLVGLSFAVSLAIAYFTTRYAVRIYPVTASIIIKEKEETSEGKLLYNNPLVSGFRNYLNELYIIRSYPLIERTLKNLNFEVAFYREGNVLTTEVYEIPVVTVVLDNGGFKSKAIYFSILDDNKFKLATIGNDTDETNESIFHFRDTVTFAGLKLSITTRRNSVRQYANQKFILSYTDASALAPSYVGRLRASWAEEGAGVINLFVNGSNPQKEIDFLNGLINEYQNYDLEKKNQAAIRTIDFITDQLNSIADSLEQVEGQLEKFKDKNSMTDLSSEAERLYKKLEPLEAQKVTLAIHNNYYEYLSSYIGKNENLDHVILPSSVGINDPILSRLLNTMVDIQLQVKMNVKSENPLVNESKRKISGIKQDIVEAITNQKATDDIQRKFLNQQINVIEAQLSRLPISERKLVSIQRNYSLLENLYVFLLQKRAEAGISKASTTSDIATVNPPMRSGGAISPKPRNNYMLAIFIGLGLPGLIFILLEIFNLKVQSKEDVEKITNIPFIGGLGHKRSDNNLEVFSSPKSSIAESFRALRSNLNYFIGQKNNVVVLITSSISGEGKTFTSINLASVLALSGKKTLIVGADMRKPKLFNDFDLSNDNGLSTYLSELSEFEQVVQKTRFSCLDLVSGGPVPPNPSELLLSPRAESFIAEARRRYDYVIIDTPPMAIVTDAFALVPLADHTLFLVRQNYTPKTLMKTIHDFYQSGKLQKLSIVLNDIYKSGPGYGYGYGYQYGYGYGYGYGVSRKNGYGYYNESTNA